MNLAPIEQGYFSDEESAMKTSIAILALSLAVMGCQGTAVNPNKSMATNDTVSPSDGMPATEVIQASDQQFVNDAAAGGIYEVEAGRMAVRKGVTSHVQMVGLHMVADHLRVGEELSGIVKKEKLKVPTEPTTEQMGMLLKLDQLAGSDFDKEYMKQQEAGASWETIAKFEAEAKGGTDGALRRFGGKYDVADVPVGHGDD